MTYWYPRTSLINARCNMGPIRAQPAPGLRPAPGSRHDGPMQLHSLFLAPGTADERPDSARVIAVLRQLAVIGEPLTPQRFAVGPGFGRHIVFAGCSPYLVTEPPADGGPAFTHLLLHGPLAQPILVTAHGQARPRCPNCRQRIAAGQIPRNPADNWQCRACAKAFSACELDWRHYGLCGRVMVEVVNVFPGEAAPSDALLQALGDATSGPWRHAWAAYLGDATGH